MMKMHGGSLMIKCASVYTYEMDNHQIALAEIKAQLDEKITLLEHSVGIVMCYTEFINTGVLKYLCDNLPFDVVGVTTASQAVNSEHGELILTMFVITADDVWFKAGATECLAEGIAGPTRTAYHQAAQGAADLPGLALVFPPLILKYAADDYVDIWEELIPHTPLFGTLAIDDTISFEGSETIYNGFTSKTAMSFVLCYGNIHPRFSVAVLPEDNIMPYKAEVTRANGPFVHEINNRNAYQYFAELGFASDGAPTESFLFVPFMIDLRKRDDYDGIPVLRGLSSFMEDGTAIFRGNVDENSIFNLSSFSDRDVISTTLLQVEKVNSLPDVNGVLSFSCIIRRMVLGINPYLELETFQDNMDSQTPFMMGYAGGEICPTSVREGIPVNRFHNYSFVTLII